jgi:hypothetical protein
MKIAVRIINLDQPKQRTNNNYINARDIKNEKFEFYYKVTHF